MKMSPEDRLREALRAQVDGVEVAPDALPRIRQRVAGRRRATWPTFAVAAAVAAMIAVAVIVLVPERTPPPDGQPAASSTPTAVAPSPQAVEPSVAGVPVKSNLPVYYAHSDKLVREFHLLTLDRDDDAGRIAAAVRESLRHGSAFDPDYATLWPDSVTVRGVTLDGRVVVVDLADVGPGPRAGTPYLAVQQLVSTVAAVTSYTSMKKADGVRILVDGKPAGKLWGTVDTARPVTQGAPSDLFAPVWVIDPQQGAQVGRSVTVHLSGIVWEGTVNLRIRGAGGVVVLEQVVQLDAGAPAVGEARVPVTLAPGRYTIEAYFISQKDSSVQGVDDHDFTVG